MADFWEPEAGELDWVNIWEARSNSRALLCLAAFGEVDIPLLPPDFLALSLLSPWVLFIRELWERERVWELCVGARDLFPASWLLEDDKCLGNPESGKVFFRERLSWADFGELDILLWSPDLLDFIFSWLLFIWEDRDLLIGEGGLPLKRDPLVLVCEKRKELSGLLDGDRLDNPESSGELECFSCSSSTSDIEVPTLPS